MDATCPYVRKVQNVARRLKEKGYTVVVVGERKDGVVDDALDLRLRDANDNEVPYALRIRRNATEQTALASRSKRARAGAWTSLSLLPCPESKSSSNLRRTPSR